MLGRKFLTVASLVSVTYAVSGCSGVISTDVYKYYPVTVAGYTGDKKISVAYTGQVARHVLHDSLKNLAGQGDGHSNDALKSMMMMYYAQKTKKREILAPKSKGAFDIKQENVDQISKKKNLSGKTYKGAISGMPGNMTGVELVEFWIDKAASVNKGVDKVNGYN
jgi:hypothetical protein